MRGVRHITHARGHDENFSGCNRLQTRNSFQTLQLLTLRNFKKASVERHFETKDPKVSRYGHSPSSDSDPRDEIVGKPLLHPPSAPTALGFWRLLLLLWRRLWYTLCLKNVPPLVCYNFDIRERILIFFGKDVTDKVRNQKTLYCATPNNLCFCTI